MFKSPAIREFFIIDGHSQIHRAYHSPFRSLSCRCAECAGKGETCDTCNGTGEEPTKATYVFTKFLIKALKTHNPKFAVVAMDSPRETLHRRTLYPHYKANRDGIQQNPDFLPQLRRIEEIVRALGIAVVRVKGYEADDVIATLVDTATALDDVYCTVVSRDKDLMQLINQNVRMYDPMAEEYLDGRHVQRKFGVMPHQMIDYQALVGDTSDNVPGVKGIGEKGAAKLLTAYPQLKDILAASDAKGCVDRLLNMIKDQREMHLLSRSLVTLRRDVPLPEELDADALRWDGLKLDKVRPIFRMLGFKKWD